MKCVQQAWRCTVGRGAATAGRRGWNAAGWRRCSESLQSHRARRAAPQKSPLPAPQPPGRPLWIRQWEESNPRDLRSQANPVGEQPDLTRPRSAPEPRPVAAWLPVPQSLRVNATASFVSLRRDADAIRLPSRRWATTIENPQRSDRCRQLLFLYSLSQHMGLGSIGRRPGTPSCFDLTSLVYREKSIDRR
ncbi:unnamed protein product, partial [Trichogramma brassicae]